MSFIISIVFSILFAGGKLPQMTKRASSLICSLCGLYLISEIVISLLVTYSSIMQSLGRSSGIPLASIE